MLKVKLIVTALYFKIICIMCINYCNICENHTLCKFVSGPSKSCIAYDNSVYVSETDITNIVNRINEKRNLIATGIIKKLPQAANMRKMYWSQELAKSAQIWADQCHPIPDYEDECRNLEHTSVGQCISFISGPTSGLNVKSFVDSWFMTSMTYSGSVSYYNESIDYNSRYFTQLIWASTYEVGCGRSKYYINNGLTPIDKLVCNFAPSGNIHGKTVYAIGFPATQCQPATSPDSIFKALCSTLLYAKDKLLETATFNANNTRHQKIRHVMWPNEYTDNDQPLNTKLYPHFIRESSYLNNPGTPLRSNLQNDKEYSSQYVYKCTRFQLPSAGKIQITSSQSNLPATSCTRRNKSSNLHIITTTPNKASNKQCTRRNRASQTKCTCDLPLKCQCFFDSQFERKHQPDLFSRELDNINRKQYYNSQKVIYDTPYVISRSDFDNSNNMKEYFKPKTHVNNFENLQPFKVILSNKHVPKSISYPYDNTRTKRQYLEENINNFWQDKMPLNRPQNIKSVRYTTLPKIKNRILTTPIRKGSRQDSSTEIITINVGDTPVSKFEYQHKIPEKYLSFDELLTLRKNNKEMIHEESRRKINRQGAQTTTSIETTTLFSKINHCSRKMTCTWTAPSNNSSRPNRGSRTPPGYVEGCTRTSTCTREFLERNKLPSSDTQSTEEEHDEDYCEKRSLVRRNLENKQKDISKNSNCKPYIYMSTKPMSATTKLPNFNGFKNYDYEGINISTDSSNKPASCIC